MFLNKTQIIVISSSFLLIVLLLLANTNLPNKEEVKSSEPSSPKSKEIISIVEAAKSDLSLGQKLLVTKLEEATKTSTDKKTAFENLINQWDSLQKPSIAAYFMEQAAIFSPNEKNWLEAGNRYYAATRFLKEKDKQLLFIKAIECFNKTLKLNPNNIEAKVNLGASYVEGSSEPMKGIGILREVEKTDSNNVNLQLNFAFFSEKSGQWDKAISRFLKILKIQPNFIEAYLHLADAYQQKGDKTKAIENLEIYITLIDDLSIKAEIQEYINNLKKS